MDVALDHPRFRTVDAGIFTRRLAPDCMVHRCTIVQDEDKTALAHPHVKLDACCQSAVTSISPSASRSSPRRRAPRAPAPGRRGRALVR